MNRQLGASYTAQTHAGPRPLPPSPRPRSQKLSVSLLPAAHRGEPTSRPPPPSPARVVQHPASGARAPLRTAAAAPVGKPHPISALGGARAAAHAPRRAHSPLWVTLRPPSSFAHPPLPLLARIRRRRQSMYLIRGFTNSGCKATCGRMLSSLVQCILLNVLLVRSIAIAIVHFIRYE